MPLLVTLGLEVMLAVIRVMRVNRSKHPTLAFVNQHIIFGGMFCKKVGVVRNIFLVEKLPVMSVWLPYQVGKNPDKNTDKRYVFFLFHT